MSDRRQLRRPPADCPVCGEHLHLTRLSCDDCGTELTGHFPASRFAALTAEDAETLEVFLRSRGNMKELERHLGVSYPTARARFDALLHRLGLTPMTADAPEPPRRPTRTLSADLLAAVARGDVDIDAAVQALRTPRR